MFIRVGGVQASGKTVFINELVRQLVGDGFDASKVSGSVVMASMLGVSVEELRMMPESEKTSAREAMFSSVYEADRMRPDKILIRDAHFCIVDKVSRQIIEIPARKEDERQMLAFILLTVEPDLLHQRRVSESSTRGDRCIQDIDLLREEILEETKAANRQAQSLGIPLLTISNNDVALQGLAEKAIRELLSLGLISK